MTTKQNLSLILVLLLLILAGFLIVFLNLDREDKSVISGSIVSNVSGFGFLKPDSDGDGVSDDLDNCIYNYNPYQEDSDFDLIGDACDDNGIIGRSSGYSGSSGNDDSECNSNSDCGTDGFIGIRVCADKNVTQVYKSFSCVNPGKITSKCESLTEIRVLETCTDYCSSGECKTFTCEIDLDCEDSNSSTEDVCVNASTSNSRCEHRDIGCKSDLDCGTNIFFGTSSCSNNDLFQEFKTFSCSNPGTSSSSCSFNISNLLKQDCGENSCSNFGANYCKSNNVYKNQTCLEKGCSGSDCFTNTIIEEFLVDSCDSGETCKSGKCEKSCSDLCISGEKMCSGDATKTCGDYNGDGCSEWGSVISCDSGKTCRNGECVKINCYADADCGARGFILTPTCKNNDLFQDFKTFTCKNPGLTTSSCEFSITNLLKQDCGENSCSNFGTNYCKSNSVYKNQTCLDKGCSDNACFSKTVIEEFLVDSCDNYCENGLCKEFICEKDLDCNDNNAYTKDSCLSSGTKDSSCKHDAIKCLNNNDCGTNIFFGDKTCKNNDLFQDFKTFSCKNPGLTTSSCEFSIANLLRLDCGETSSSSGSNYCEGNSVFKNRTWVYRGCSGASCFANPEVQKVLVTTCANSCLNANCVECTPGATKQCGVSSVGECKFGMQTCSSVGAFGSCVGAVFPTEEVCYQGTDNNCDGKLNVNCITPQCMNGIDDDGDGKTDYPADPGCLSYIDNSEY